jgi:hypothetical protein
MNSYLCQELNITDDKLRNDNLYALCVGQVQILGYVQVERLLWRGSQALCEQEITPGDLTLHEQVIAAISVRFYQPMRTLLPKLTAYRFRFDARSPLVAAVAIKGDEMLKLALDHIPSMKAQNAHLTMKDLNVRLAINLAIQQLSVERTIILLEYVQAHNLNGVKDLYHESLKYDIKFSVKPNLKLVRSILEHCPGGQTVIPDIFLHACKSGNIELVKLLLGHMDLDKGTVLTLPLHQAIKSGDAAIIGAVLDAGADINNTNYVKNTKKSAHNGPKSPLEFAITQKFKAVEALLRRGAIVPPPEKWRDAGKTVYTALRSARIVQTGEKCLLIRKPKRSAGWNHAGFRSCR